MMDAHTSPLVLTKLRVPAMRSQMVPRTRLIDLLAPVQGMSLILVCAPAGYGKTTLLTTWAHSLIKNGSAVAWYALDQGDDDPIPFGSYLIASFIQAIGPVAELIHTAQRLRASPELDLQRILPELINTISSSPMDCVLILDDYHLIRSPAIHSAIAYLVQYCPENLHIAIGSRSDPPLPLARLRAQRQLLDIRTNSLRFNIEEAAQFLNQAMRLQLSQERIAALEARTEGWIAGLQLASLRIQAPFSPSYPLEHCGAIKDGDTDAVGNIGAQEDGDPTISGSHRYLVEYLMEEVFDRQNGEVQSFFLNTAMLERMNAPLCAAILEGTIQTTPSQVARAEAILRQLEKANLFVIGLDEQGDWYRYHHLFREFLQSRLNKSQPGRVRALHRAASTWLAANGFLREAAAHAFQTQDWEIAAAFVEQHSFILILHSEISTIYEWCSAFPEEVMLAHPRLCILQALSLAYNFRLKNRDKVEARLQQASHWIEQKEDMQLAQELLELSAVVRTFLSMAPDPAADPYQLLALANSMLGHYPPDDPGQFSARLLTGYAWMALQETQAAKQAFAAARQMALRGGLYFGVVESTFHLARLAYSQGRLSKAAEICRQGQADIAVMLPQAEQELPALGCLEVTLGWVLLEQNQLEEAELRIRRGLDQMGTGMNPHYLMTAYLSLFRLNEILGRSAEAVKCLNHLESIWPDLIFCTRGLRIIHALRVSPHDPCALADASDWCDDFLPGQHVRPPGLGPFGAADAYYLASLAWIRAQMALGNAPEIEPYLKQQLDLALEHGLFHRVIELSLLEAELAAQTKAVQDNRKRVREAIERALAAAKPEGYIRTFDQGPSLDRLLAAPVRHGIYQPYLKQILAAIGISETIDQEKPESVDHERHVHGKGLVESLTERELEILHLMALGATNQAIAEQLVITIGTVKSHINHILGKFGAHNRTEAVARARETGILKV
jgi:LuxR family transcriptional regulator, maltose regulon positive regulatory protein